MQKVYLTKKFEFEAAHMLRDYVGACKNLHGHSYKVEVTLSGYIDVPSDRLCDNMLVDFKLIKGVLLERTLKKYDHTYLNESLGKDFTNGFYAHPTAEFMAVHFYDEIKKLLQYIKPQVEIESIKVWETSDSCAEYRGENR